MDNRTTAAGRCFAHRTEPVPLCATAAEGKMHRLSQQLQALPSDWRLVRVGSNKAPIAGAGWFDVDDYSPDDAAELNGSGPPAWGLKCGPASGGVLVLDLDAEGWRESFQEVTGHPITDLPRTIGWTSGKPDRSGHAFTVDPDWWPHLANVRPITRPWKEGDPIGKKGLGQAETLWELRWNRCQSVILGAHPETGRYRWLPTCSPDDIPEPAPAPDWLLEVLLIQEHPDAPAVEPTAEDAQRALAMLAALPPAEFSAYSDWLRVGMALHHTDPGLLTAWVEWSRQMANFDEAECLQKWESFGKGHKGTPATIRTLHYLAKRYDYKEPRRARQSRRAAPAAAASAGEDAEPAPPPPAPFRILGWNLKRDAIWIQSGGIGQVAAVPTTQSGLQRMAPVSYWEAIHPSRSGIDWSAAVSSVCEQAEQAGVFTPDRLRGRGVWLDRGRVVWNLGDRLEVDGTVMPFSAATGTAYTYASLPALEINPEIEALTDEEGAAILELIHRRMAWYGSADGLLLAGHAVIANVGGAMELRPGLQLTGPSQGGKSTTINGTIRPLQGGLGLLTSASTEAGIRQALQLDCLPAVIDESEQENATQREGHLRLLRLSFDGQEQIKGSQGGQPVRYSMRSAITLSGINATVPNLADRNRLVIVRPRKMTAEEWSAVLEQRNRLLTIEAGCRLIRRTVSNLPALLANVRVFTAVAAGITSTSRSAEVYGCLLAGAHHLTSTAEISREDALNWLDAIGWEGLDEDEREAVAVDVEGRACLATLLGHSVPWKPSQTGSIDVRGLLQLAANSAADEARSALGRLGIKRDKELGLVVSNDCRVFTGTRWANGAHRDRLLELPGATVPSTPPRFAGGGKKRGVAVPLELADLDS